MPPLPRVVVYLVLALLPALVSAGDAPPSATEQALARLPTPDLNAPASFTFKEARSYPFRKYPKDFSGTVQLEQEGQLAIHYHFPSTYTLAIGSQGAQLIEENGDTRDLGNPPELALLRELLRGDREALAQQWALVSSDAETSPAQLVLKPRGGALADAVAQLTITYDAERVYTVQVAQRDGIQRDYRFEPMQPGKASPETP